jgi:hypothetical protein
MLFPSATEKFLRALPSATLPKPLLDELFECIESYVTLDDASAIAAHDPAASLRVSKVRYLLFALEAHVSEFYIFCQRLDALLTRFERTYRSSKVSAALQPQLKRARQLIATECSPIVALRGRHVHQRRYFDHTSPLRRMSLDAIRHPTIRLTPEKKHWKRIKVLELRRLRQRNHIALRLLKFAFVSINRVLLLPPGAIIPP